MPTKPTDESGMIFLTHNCFGVIGKVFSCGAAPELIPFRNDNARGAIVTQVDHYRRIGGLLSFVGFADFSYEFRGLHHKTSGAISSARLPRIELTNHSAGS
jgi:hypothetical protein